MMGRLEEWTKVNCSTIFILATRFPKIIWCARSTLRSIFPCFEAELADRIILLMGRPSIDPELMIRMLIVGYVFAIRSERLICREVQVNSCLSVVLQTRHRRTLSRIIRLSRARVTSVFVRGMFFAACLSVSSRRAFPSVWLVAKDLQVDVRA